MQIQSFLKEGNKTKLGPVNFSGSINNFIHLSWKTVLLTFFVIKEKKTNTKFHDLKCFCLSKINYDTVRF
mgnify:CR=1 FL=1